MIHAVLLAYNEADNLPRLLEDLGAALGAEPEAYRIIVVDDGSSDGTAAASRRAAARLPVTVLSHPQNLGVARAFDTGLRFALAGAGPADLVVTMEGDGSNRPSTLPAMLERLRAGCDVVCASRHRDGGGYVGFPRRRLALSLGANALARLLLRVPGVRDYTLFYRGYRAEALRRAIDVYGERFIEARGFSANAEILLKVARAGAYGKGAGTAETPSSLRGAGAYGKGAGTAETPSSLRGAGARPSPRCAEVPTLYRYDLRRGSSKLRVAASLREYLELFLRAARM